MPAAWGKVMGAMSWEVIHRIGKNTVKKAAGQNSEMRPWDRLYSLS